MTKQHLLVIGNGMAAGRTLEHLMRKDPQRYQVTVLGAEPRVNYDRIMLSPVLAGEKTYQDIIIHDEAWYASSGIKLHKGCTVSHIDRAAKQVKAQDGRVFGYDKLLIATGSAPFIIPIPGHDLPGVLSYRDVDDVEAMLERARAPGRRAVVIGGGLLGLEAAYGLKTQGMDVTVLHLMPTLMERQLDETAGRMLEHAIQARGIKVITQANTKAILGVDAVQSVQLADGTLLPADLVVMAVGIRPNIALAKQAGLDVDRGIVIDDHMTTSDASIFAVGECVQHRGQCYGLVAPLYDMAGILARRLSGNRAARYTGSVTSTKLKVTGIDLFSAGDFAAGDAREDMVFQDAPRGIYRRLVLEDNRIVGAVLYGDTSDGAWFFEKLQRGSDISDIRETLIFGQAYDGGGPLDPMAAVAASPDKFGCSGLKQAA